MLKVIKRVLRLSGDLSKRIYASFVCQLYRLNVWQCSLSGLCSIPSRKLQNNKAICRAMTGLVLFGILIISLVVRMVFKYLVY